MSHHPRKRKTRGEREKDLNSRGADYIAKCSRESVAEYVRKYGAEFVKRAGIVARPRKYQPPKFDPRRREIRQMLHRIASKPRSYWEKECPSFLKPRWKRWRERLKVDAPARTR